MFVSIGAASTTRSLADDPLIVGAHLLDVLLAGFVLYRLPVLPIGHRAEAPEHAKRGVYRICPRLGLSAVASQRDDASKFLNDITDIAARPDRDASAAAGQLHKVTWPQPESLEHAGRDRDLVPLAYPGGVLQRACHARDHTPSKPCTWDSRGGVWAYRRSRERSLTNTVGPVRSAEPELRSMVTTALSYDFRPCATTVS
jgi:hypothetical protein